MTGKLVALLCGPIRTEEDFLAHGQAIVAIDPLVTRWHIVCDTPTIHPSESLVRRVAQISGIEQDLGKKGDDGILAVMPHRATFFRDPTHNVVFHAPPNQRSWLNHIDIWLSILVRTVLTRGSCVSVEA